MTRFVGERLARVRLVPDGSIRWTFALFRFARTMLIVTGVSLVGIMGMLWHFQDSLIYPAPPDKLGEPTIMEPGFSVERTTTEDGLDLRFWAAPPKPGQPVLVYFHGNADTARTPADKMFAFQGKGYGAVMAEYRGYGGNPGKPSQDGLIRDGRAQVAWARAKWPGSAIVLWGESIGTGVATAIAIDKGYLALVLDAPFTSILDVAEDKFPLLPIRFFLRSPFRSLANMARIDVPVLVVQGADDTFIPLKQGAAMERAAKCRGGIVAVPKVGHPAFVNDRTGIARDAISAFLEKVRNGDFPCQHLVAAPSHG